MGAPENKLPSVRPTALSLDSWIYPAMERLAAQGVVKTDFLGLRPWTRMAVYQMIAGATVEGDSPAAALLASVRTELQREAEIASGQPNTAMSIDQIYARTQNLSGTPLNDSYHFGQTINDYFGRRYGSGWQQIAGVQGRAQYGRFSFFLRGEYQHSPSIPGYPASVAQIIANQDKTPLQTFNGTGTRDTLQLLDTYVSANWLGHEISFGKQSYCGGRTRAAP